MEKVYGKKLLNEENTCQFDDQKEEVEMVLTC